MTKLYRSEQFASRAHAGQKYGDAPYTEHLAAVVKILRVRGFEERLQAAGWLHDVLEDTAVSSEEMTKVFGQRITSIVEAVTTPRTIGNRRERLEALIVLLTARPEAIAVKLADRLANARASLGTPMDRMYRKEYPRFREGLFPLSSDPAILALWQDLDNLLAVSP